MQVTRASSALLPFLCLLQTVSALDCIQIIDNIEPNLNESFIHLFPKDYTVQLRVSPQNLKPCVWTALSRLLADWNSLLSHLWHDQENWQRAKWTTDALRLLNSTVPQGLSGVRDAGHCADSGCDHKPVSNLVGITLKLLRVLRDSNCARTQEERCGALGGRRPLPTVSHPSPGAREEEEEEAGPAERLRQSVMSSPRQKPATRPVFLKMSLSWMKMVSKQVLTQLRQLIAGSCGETPGKHGRSCSTTGGRATQA